MEGADFIDHRRRHRRPFGGGAARRATARCSCSRPRRRSAITARAAASPSAITASATPPSARSPRTAAPSSRRSPRAFATRPIARTVRHALFRAARQTCPRLPRSKRPWPPSPTRSVSSGPRRWPRLCPVLRDPVRGLSRSDRAQARCRRPAPVLRPPGPRRRAAKSGPASGSSGSSDAAPIG